MTSWCSRPRPGLLPINNWRPRGFGRTCAPGITGPHSHNLRVTGKRLYVKRTSRASIADRTDGGYQVPDLYRAGRLEALGGVAREV